MGVNVYLLLKDFLVCFQVIHSCCFKMKCQYRTLYACIQDDDKLYWCVFSPTTSRFSIIIHSIGPTTIISAGQFISSFFLWGFRINMLEIDMENIYCTIVDLSTSAEANQVLNWICSLFFAVYVPSHWLVCKVFAGFSCTE